MSKRSIVLLATGRDGTSQRERRLLALDPNSARIDERGTRELLAFVQAFAEQVRYFEAGTDEPVETASWSSFARHPEISVADILSYIEDPARFSGEKARWLGRPHFGLLLAFLELLRHARDQLNGTTARHLDYYYRQVLSSELEPATPDRAAVVFALAARSGRVRIAPGTELQAGRDSSGLPLIYRTQRELIVGRAQVASLRSVFVDRRITGLEDVLRDRDLRAPAVLEQMLALALGRPRPGDAVPPWEGAAIEAAFFQRLRGPLAFARSTLYLQHHELRELMRLVHRRENADAEWDKINGLLGVTNPADPRDFQRNLEARVGVLDLEHDGFPEIESVDDLYRHRGDPATETLPSVREYISKRLAAIGGGDGALAYARFLELMPIKLRIDAEWAEINRLLARAGRRKRNLLSWTLDTAAPTQFAENLSLAIGQVAPPLPFGTQSVAEYEAKLRALEVHLSMPIERIAELAAVADHILSDTDPQHQDWSDVLRNLADARRELFHAIRRAKLADVRGALANLAGLARVANFVLGSPSPALGWPEALGKLAEHLDASQLTLLRSFGENVGDPVARVAFDWPDAYRLLELAQSRLERVTEPVPERTEWHNLYAYEDATAVLADPERSQRWRSFGERPREPGQRGATIGWAIQTPLLALSGGLRMLTLTLGFDRDGFDRASLLRALGVVAPSPTVAEIVAALESTLVVSISTADGWSALPIGAARIASGRPGDDYWSLLGVPRVDQDDRPALQLEVSAGVAHAAFAALASDGAAWPALRISLEQIWNDDTKEWTTRYDVFEPLRLLAAHLAVTVDGLPDVRLQQEDRPLDPKKPFEPFGSAPAAGSRLYVEHPELTRVPLDSLHFDVEWMGLPDDLHAYYKNYTEVTSSAVFKTHVMLVDRRRELDLLTASLFDEAGEPQKTQRQRSIAVPSVRAAIDKQSPGYPYERSLAPGSSSDLREEDRYFVWELDRPDFGHSIYPVLSANKARDLAIALRGATAPNSDEYRVNPPYTPKIKRLRIGYTSSVELEPGTQTRDDALLHVEPFGVSRMADDAPSFLPSYGSGGELYIGLRDVDAPESLALLVQLAEGTSDPDRVPSPIAWSVLDGDRWLDLSAAGVRYDATRGWINSGIVELALPAASRGTRLPAELYWVRASIARDVDSVCDAVGLRAQAVAVRFEDRGNAPDHYLQPLPPGSIDRLVVPEPGIAGIEQPYSSFGGKPVESSEALNTRVSERLRHKHRALASWDYERLVLRAFPQIYKAKCLPSVAARNVGSQAGFEPGRVTVVVIPDIRQLLPSDVFAPKAPANLLADIHRYLTDRASESATVAVRNARYVSVMVRLGVRFRSDQDEGQARQRLDRDLVRFLSPWAFDDGADVAIGGRIYANSIVDFVDRREYVDYVAEIKLFRSSDGKDFTLEPPTAADYHVAAVLPDEVLVSAPHHLIDVIPEAGYDQSSFTGINYMRIELDFIVG